MSISSRPTKPSSISLAYGSLSDDVYEIRSRDLDSEQAAVWLRETEVERNQLAILRKAINKQPKLSIRKTEAREQFGKEAERFFVCNTNRRNLLNDDEKSMHDRGYATAWEDFRYPTHMNRVEEGDAIYMYAKGKGIIGVGRAMGPVEKLESGACNRVVPVGKREWRIPTEWLAWNSDRPFQWKGQNNTFLDISADKYEDLRKGLERHFSEIR
jgi:hypothetical protein